MDITQLYKIYLKPGMLPEKKLVQVTIEPNSIKKATPTGGYCFFMGALLMPFCAPL